MEAVASRPRLLREASSSEFPSLDTSMRQTIPNKQLDVWRPKPTHNGNSGTPDRETWFTKESEDEHAHQVRSNGLGRDNGGHRPTKHSISERQRRCSVSVVGHRGSEISIDSSIGFRSCNNNRDFNHNNGTGQRYGGQRGSWAGETRRCSFTQLKSNDRNGNGARARSHHPSEASSDLLDSQQWGRTEEEIRKLKPMKLQFWRTKMCPWVTSLGNCRKGASCRYAHSDEELRPLPDLTKTKMCDDYARTGHCLNRRTCKYAHSIEELRATMSFSKTKLCPLWLQRACTAGSDCRFAHGEQELRYTALPVVDDYSSHSKGVDRERSEGNSMRTGNGRKQSRRESFSSSRESDGSDKQEGFQQGGGVPHDDRFPRGERFPQSVPDQEAEWYLSQQNNGNNGIVHHNQQNQTRQLSTVGCNYGVHPHQSTANVPSISVTPSQDPNGLGWVGQPPHQQSQSSIVDPAMFFQGLSPMSLRVATNALVYLSELQHSTTWPTNPAAPSMNQNLASATPSTNDISSASLQNPQPTTGDPPTVAEQQQQYTPMLYPQSPTMHPTSALWGAPISSSNNMGQLLQRGVGQGPTPMMNQTTNQPLPSSQQPTVVSGTPLRYFNQNMAFSTATSTPMNRPPGFSPMSNSAATIEHSGVETGRFVTTHLLPSGMFSPMTQRSFRTAITSQNGHQQMKSSPQPIDLFLSFPTTTAQQQQQSPSHIDMNEQSTIHSEHNSTSIGSSNPYPSAATQQPHYDGNLHMCPPPQFHDVHTQETCLPNPPTTSHPLFAWNPNSSTGPQVVTPAIFPLDLHQQQHQHNTNPTTTSPNIFFSASATHPTSTPFQSPVLSTTAQAAQPPSINSSGLSPASYATAVSFPNGIASPTTAILTTLNLLPAPQQQASSKKNALNNNHQNAIYQHFKQHTPDSEPPIIPGFPLLAFLASQPILSDSSVMTANHHHQHQPNEPTVMVDHMNKDLVNHSHANGQACAGGSPLEHSPSLFSSKSSSERTSTGSPTTTAATTAHQHPFYSKALAAKEA